MQDGQIQGTSTKGHKHGKILMNHENQELFCVALEQQIQEIRNNADSKDNNGENKHLSSSTLIPLQRWFEGQQWGELTIEQQHVDSPSS